MIGGVFYWILTKCNCAYFTYITINIPIDSMAYIPREKVMLGLQNFYTMINIVLFPANFLKFPSVTSSAIIKIQTTNLGITNSRVNQHTPTQQNSVKNWETIKNQFCLKKRKNAREAPGMPMESIPHSFTGCLPRCFWSVFSMESSAYNQLRRIQ